MIVNLQKTLTDRHSFLESTYLLDIRQGSPLSSKMSQFKEQNYETAFGEKVNFTQWYSTSWIDTRVLFMTQLTSSFGFIWGVSTGENAEKYTIKPELTLGFVYQNKISKNSSLTISGTTFINGNLKEKTCTANYGEIGGVQTVNCRLVASTLSPSETLNYLVNEKPNHDRTISIKWIYKF